MSAKKLLGRLLYQGTPSLRPYERRCLEEVAKEVGESAAATLWKQIAIYDLIQRNLGDTIVDFKLLDSADRARMPVFQNKSKEKTWANLTLETGAGPPLRCKVEVHNGYVSSLEFSSPPKVLGRDPFRISVCRVVIDIEAEIEPRT